MIQILKSTFHLFSYVSSPGFTKKINCPYTRPSCDFRDVSYNGYVDSNKLVHSLESVIYVSAKMEIKVFKKLEIDYLQYNV